MSMLPSADRLELLCDQGAFPAPGQLDCAALCVGGRYTAAAVSAYAGSSTRISTLIDWPTGLGKPTVRQIEAVAAAKDGTHAIELMAHMPHVTSGNAAALRDDLMGVIIAVREVSRAIEVNVVIEAEWIGDDAKLVESACLAVRESGGDGIVTGSDVPGKGPAYRQAVAAVKQFAGPLSVKAMLPTAELDELDSWFDLGADRVGLCTSVLMGM